MSSSTDDAKSTAASEDELTEKQFLEAYKKKEYPKPSVTADIVVFRRCEQGLEVLLVRRGKHPFQGCWALPGGFANPNEDVIDAAQRELEEETGVTGVPIELFGIYGAPGRDPRGWTVSGGFCAVVGSDMSAQAGDDAADARWCPITLALAEQPSFEGEAPESKQDDTRTLTVKCSDEESAFTRFCLIPQEFGAPRAHLIGSSGFAFDHAQLLADAFLKVTQGETTS